MNKLNTAKRVAILKALTEGVGVNATSRLTGASKNTILKLLAEVGLACAQYQHEHLQNLPCKHLQCDEIWSFVGMKAKNVPESRKGEEGIGDVWTWVALCADTKLVPCWLVGARDIEHAVVFMQDLASRLTSRVQLTTDGLKAYMEAVGPTFNCQIDYAMLHKIYRTQHIGEGRYSPPECVGCDKRRVWGNPDPAHISTSFIERQNLTMRMRMRRFTRLTNGFSKKLENHEYMIALHYMVYNFVRRHETLRMSPAMAAGVDNRLWSVNDIVSLIA